MQASAKLSKLGVKDIEIKQAGITGIVSLLFCKNEIYTGSWGWLGLGNQVVFIIRDLTLSIKNTTKGCDTVNCYLK